MAREPQNNAAKFEWLREKAKALIAERPRTTARKPVEILEVIHELEIHQLELELQNEELKRAQDELMSLYHNYEKLYEFAPCGYLNLTEKGMISRINLTGVAVLNAPRQIILRSGFSQYVVPDCQKFFFSALKKASQTGEKQSVELQLKRSDGPGPWIWMEIAAEPDEAGQKTQLRMTLADISSKKEAESALSDSERKYKALFSTMVSGAALLEIADRNNTGQITDVRFVEVNNAFEKLTGITRKEAIGQCIRNIWPQTEQFWFDQIGQAMQDGQSIQMEGFHKEIGKHFLLSAFRIDRTHLGTTFIDISAHIKLEEELKKDQRNLKIQVDQGTAELLRKTEELKVRQARLEEANAALKILLRSYEEERSEWEEMVVSNIEAHTRPYLAKLAAARLSQHQRTLLDAVNGSLDDITSPLSRRLIIESIKLTPSETQVAKLIRQGKSTKEISRIAGVATSTIDFHRHNIRKKLKLSNQQVNLQSYLQSLE